MKDYYSILGVSEDATKEEIKKKFRILAQRYHPDKKTGDEKKFKEISEAKEILLDDGRRQTYDAQRRGVPGGGEGFGFNGFSTGDVNINDIFQQMFKTAYNKGADISLQTTISFEESVFGTTKKTVVPYRTKQRETLDIPIPPNTENGMQFQLDGKGELGKEGARSGDAILTIYVLPHPTFRKERGNLIAEAEVRLTDLLLGDKKIIKGVKGEDLEISIPKNSKNGDTLTLSKYGIPQPYGTGKTIVVLNLIKPTKISRKAESLIKELKEEGL